MNTHEPDLDLASHAFGDAWAKRISARPPAVVVGGDADGLGIARSLGRAGVPVILADVDARRPAMHSRYLRPYVIGAMSGPLLIDSLLALRAQLDCRPVLFLTTDRQVQALSEYRERMDKAYHLRFPSHRCVSTLLHKQGFQHEAERLGFPVPRALRVSSEQDLIRLDEMHFPVVVKPGDKELFFSGKAARACKVRSLAEAEAVCKAALPQAPDLIVQEWVEGRESDIYFCLQYRGEGGVTVSSFVGRKLRCWPPETGSTACCTAAPEVQALLEKVTQAFFDESQVVGMCSMEFKRDCGSGKFFMIEPTIGRADWQEEVATLNDMNIPLAAYCYELGLPAPEVNKPPRPVTWMYPPSYWRSVFARWSLDGSPLGVLRMKTPCWTFRDPVPLAYFMLEWIRKAPAFSRWRKFIREQMCHADQAAIVAVPDPSAKQVPLHHAAKKVAAAAPRAKGI